MSPHTTAASQASFHMNERTFGREVAQAPAQVEIITTADGVGYHIRNSACILIVILDEIHLKKTKPNDLQFTVSQTSETQDQQFGSEMIYKMLDSSVGEIPPPKFPYGRCQKICYVSFKEINRWE